jgi:energy-coupling factor transporter ATP-binding protein EcfA2
MDTIFGQTLMGNFRTDEIIEGNDVFRVEKLEDSLFLRLNNRQVRLVPFHDDRNASEIIKKFSNYSGEENDSIYKVVTLKSNQIAIFLSVFQSSPIKITTPGDSLNFYVSRKIESDVKTKLKSDNLPDRLSEIFKMHRSIFVLMKQDQNDFSVYSKEYRADCNRERSGVLCINNLVENRSNRNFDRVSQVFGNINFLTYEESLKRQGVDIQNNNVMPIEILNIWESFIDFQVNDYRQKQIERGYLNYKSKVYHDSETITLYFDKEGIYEHSLFINQTNDEYECLIFENEEQYKNYNDIEEIIGYSYSSTSVINIGKAVKFTSNSVTFRNQNLSNFVPSQGLVILSSNSIQIEHRRRKKMMKDLRNIRSNSLNSIFRITNGYKDDQKGGKLRAVNTRTLEQMFGDKNFKISDNFREAISIAVNTPDYAVIQGPPGTGKTTLIKGIVSRILENNKNARILISSEQHEAVYNAVERVSKNSIVPPYILSRQRNSDSSDLQSRVFKNIESFQKELVRFFTEKSDLNRSQNSRKSQVDAILDIFNKIRKSDYDTIKIRESLPEIKRIVFDLGILDEVRNAISSLDQAMFYLSQVVEFDESPRKKLLRRKIEMQRITSSAFLDDGEINLDVLQDELVRQSFSDYLLSPSLYENLKSRDIEIISKYITEYSDYVENLILKLFPHERSNVFESYDIKRDIEVLYKLIKEKVSNMIPTFEDVMDEMSYLSEDFISCVETVKKYSHIFASTCAQAGNVKEILTGSSTFDYVIIDEAARANPIDIMIPIIYGNIVILIGDQSQLPQYIDSKAATKYSEKIRNKSDAELLGKSLFALLYEKAEKAYSVGNIECKRHIRVLEQHRMHPTIGEFISKTFYEGTVKNGQSTFNNINNYNVYNNKNVVWLDVPMSTGIEEYDLSYFRKSEIQTVIKTIQKIYSVNSTEELSIGIISYYRKQVEIINEIIKSNMTIDQQRNISCNTVDSFQGREFDIVILTTVRSNTFATAQQSIGFIHNSSNRINVSLSRSRKLLIVVGDSETFCRNEIFSEFVKYVKEVGHYERITVDEKK